MANVAGWASEIDRCLATACTMLEAEGMADAASLLRRSTAKVEETGFDNWNGGTRIWTIFLFVDAADYARMAGEVEGLEAQIDQRLKPILEQLTDDWHSVKVRPRVERRDDWRRSDGGVSRAARMDVVDEITLSGLGWSGRLEEVEFLERLYDLEALPSDDSRFKTASGDIWQHRVNNHDWDDDWVFRDARFDLMDGPAETFLRFLCEMLHPVVRRDRNEVLRLANAFNAHLREEGWALVEEEKVVGRPRYVPRRVRDLGQRAISRSRSVAEALDAGYMQKQIAPLENAVERDPELAIGTAKELVETCCKSILSKRGVEFSRKADLPELTKLVSKELRLVPEGISEESRGAETVRLILRNLGSLTQYLAELRGLYGSGHGRDGRHRGLEPRHARLAVGAAVAFIDFVTATYQSRLPPESPLDRDAVDS